MSIVIVCGSCGGNIGAIGPKGCRCGNKPSGLLPSKKTRDEWYNKILIK